MVEEAGVDDDLVFVSPPFPSVANAAAAAVASAFAFAAASAFTASALASALEYPLWDPLL